MYTELTSSDNTIITAWVDGPQDAANGIVLLPEIFGITEHLKQMARHYAEQGYRAICPALFDRADQTQLNQVLPYDQDGTQKGLALRAAISDTQALQDIEAAAQALKQQQRVFLSGFCWGGFLSWRTACLSNVFKAASCWYGGHINDYRNDSARIAVQMHFGADDPHIPLSAVEQIRSAQPQVEVHVHQNAGHAFARENTPAYCEQAATTALAQTLAFFQQHA